MPSALVWMQTDGAQKYREAARRLRKAGRGDLQRRMTKEIRTAGQPALAALRAAWMTVEVESSKGGNARPDKATGLRRRAARASRIQAQQRGIRIYTSGAKVDPKYPSLVTYLNGFPRRRPWRHPVFGNRNNWVAQRGQEVFYPTLKAFAPEWRRGVMKAIEETLREIDG